jgi:ElaB/YqjD/DUF883 family membrane-anchored ribosome-binding protein
MKRGKTMDKDVEALRDEITALRKDLGAVVHTIKDMGAERGTAAYERMQQAAERARAQGQKAADSIADGVEHKPFTSLASAFGIGLLLGLLFSGRR